MMIEGSLTTTRSVAEVRAILRPVLAAADCEVLHEDDEMIRLRHGTYLASAAPLLPKAVVLRFSPEGDTTRVAYQVEVAGLVKAWAICVGGLFFWLVFPPILVHRALTHHPRRFMENLLRAVK
jgi:hypothetical protein